MDTLRGLFLSLVRSRLEYGALVWAPIYAVHCTSIDAVQKRFLKWLVLKMDGVYPARGTPYDELLTRFRLPSLTRRRKIIAVKFCHALLHNHVDCAALLQRLNLLVPRLSSRSSATFYSQRPRTNMLFGSPISTMIRCVNEVSDQYDIFNCGLANIATYITE